MSITENEIVKELKLCLEHSKDLLNWLTYRDKPFYVLLLAAIDLIERLQADKEALIAGQETLQKYLAIIEANGISVEKYKDSINCLEKACDELKEALKKKDDELKAVRHYYNECLKDLKKAHAEINELTEKLECLLCHATGSKLSKSTYSLRTMESAVNDEVQECCEEAKAEAIKEFAEFLKSKATAIHKSIDGNYLYELSNNFIDNLVKEMVGDTE